MNYSKEEAKKSISGDTVSIIRLLFNVLKGLVIGIGAILPGISGGVMCVIFGIYHPMMAFLSAPIKSFKKYYRLLIPVLMGWVIGALLVAKLVGYVLTRFELFSIWLFIGLIAGTIPSIINEANKHMAPREKGKLGKQRIAAMITLAIAFVVMLGWLLFASNNTGQSNVKPTFVWWIICGMLWGIGLIIPGLSPSAFFIFMGLYAPMMEGIGGFSLDVIIPMGIGLIACVILLSKLIKYLIDRFYTIVFYAIIGIVAASMIAIIPFDGYYSLPNIAVCTLCFAVGCAVAFFMGKMEKKLNYS